MGVMTVLLGPLFEQLAAQLNQLLPDCRSLSCRECVPNVLGQDRVGRWCCFPLVHGVPPLLERPESGKTC